MRKTDQEIIASRKQDWSRALAAAALKLREDRRLLGATNLRDKMAELGALQAITGENRSIGKSVLENMSQENVTMYIEGLEAATTAAKAVLSS